MYLNVIIGSFVTAGMTAAIHRSLSNWGPLSHENIHHNIFSQLSIIQYMELCVFSLPIPLVMIEIIHTLSYYHHQIRSLNYYPSVRVRE